MSSNEHVTRHLLPDPSDEDDTNLVKVGSDKGLKFDSLGPVVVNNDGVNILSSSIGTWISRLRPQTLSRIANWASMTEIEREHTMKVLIARNRIRIANQEKKAQETSADALHSNAEK